MLPEEERNLRMKFLLRNFPVYRIKSNMRFKRAIILDINETYHLSNKESMKTLYERLLTILKTVFYTDDNLNKDILKTFLHLK